jgi:hypothetical protein
MAGDKDGLVSELRELRDKLLPTMERDRARVEAEGRPFNVLDWMLGRPISEKYPAGPPFRVRGVAALGNIQALDACATNLHRGTMLTPSRTQPNFPPNTAAAAAARAAHPAELHR